MKMENEFLHNLPGIEMLKDSNARKFVVLDVEQTFTVKVRTKVLLTDIPEVRTLFTYFFVLNVFNCYIHILN